MHGEAGHRRQRGQWSARTAVPNRPQVVSGAPVAMRAVGVALRVDLFATRQVYSRRKCHENCGWFPFCHGTTFRQSIHPAQSANLSPDRGDGMAAQDGSFLATDLSLGEFARKI
jgi:hypothetical protein